MADRYKVKFLPSDQTCYAQEGESILDLAMRSGVHINATCGGNGTCGRCRVEVTGDNVASTAGAGLNAEGHEAGVRLACMTYPTGDVVVTIPLESQVDRTVLRRSAQVRQRLSSENIEGLVKGWHFEPSCVKKYLQIAPPSLDDNASDVTRLVLELKKQTGMEAAADFEILPDLAGLLREADWKITVTLYRLDEGWRIQRVEPGDAANRNYTLAVDIGTTTIWAQLFYTADTLSEKGRVGNDAKDRVMAESSDYNSQISFGEDVISRILFAQKPEGLKKLQESVIDTINRLSREMAERTGIDMDDVMQVIAAGNTTMTHLALGLNPRYLMLEPYIPTTNEVPVIRAKRIGLQVAAEGLVHFFPSVASYVGGDIVSGVLGAGIFQREEIVLFIDLGTNGEIVVGNREWLTCASCSAGPAFEGGGISSGVRAGRGAIEQVHISPSTFEPMLLTIGKTKPIGFCGSGLIDALAELFLSGLLEQNGRFKREAGTERVRERQGVWEYVFCYAPDTAIGRDIVITEADIDNLLRAKAAVYAGCRVLLENVGLAIHDIERVIIAGGFGHFISLERAKIIGLFPDIPDDRFLFLGNGSLLGTGLASLSYGLSREAKGIAQRMTNIELSNSAKFMDEFMAAMFIPHTDNHAFSEILKRIGRAPNHGDADS